jgi:hypothetical protein
MKKLFAYLSILAALIFSIAVVALLFLAPEIDPLRSGISFYALTDYKLLIGAGLSLVGLAGIFLAMALWGGASSATGRIGLALLVAWGITSVLAGIFPLDAPGAPPTLSGSIHNLAGLNFLLIAPAVLLIDLPRPKSEGSQTGTRGLAWLVLVSAILLFTFNGPLSSLGIGGLIQRLYWLVLVLWLLSKSRHIPGTDR